MYKTNYIFLLLAIITNLLLILKVAILTSKFCMFDKLLILAYSYAIAISTA